MLVGGLLFAVLLCFKHIFLYLAPAYFVYLLRVYCLYEKPPFRVRFGKSFTLGAGLILVFGACFGPFLYWGQLEQLLSRLFPFSRGLCHAYWAPNFWALYSFSDRVLLSCRSSHDCFTEIMLMILVAPRLGLAVDRTATDSVTRGLVGDTSFTVLPTISPRMTFSLTAFFQMVILACTMVWRNTDQLQLSLGKLFLNPSRDMFLRAVTLCGYASFLFGWHVHEKAVLLIIIPFSLVALQDRRHLGAFRPLAVAGHVSLFPLLFTAAEFPVKSVYTLFWLILFLSTFDRIAPVSSRTRLFLFDRFSILYIAISIPLLLYCSLLHPLFFGERYEFLPLMFISTYSAIGVVGSWIGFSVVYFTT
jgi:alpha-1,3-glucosyltransferase